MGTMCMSMAVAGIPLWHSRLRAEWRGLAIEGTYNGALHNRNEQHQSAHLSNDARRLPPLQLFWGMADRCS